MNHETAEERPHHPHGPSSLKHKKECPGYQSREGETEATAMGTRIHHAVENRDGSQLEDEKEIWIYEECVKGMDEAIDNLHAITGVQPVVMIEERLHMDLIVTDTFGTADVVALADRDAALIDHKSGVSHIDPPPDNLQSMAYAIGVFQANPQVETIHARFTVPQCGEPLDGIYYRSQLPEYMKEIAKIILDAERVSSKWTDDGGTPSMHELSPCESCAWCKNQDRCPALGAIAIEVATRYAPEVLPADGVRFEDFDDPVEVGKMLVIAGIMEKWAKGYKYKTVTAVKDGELELPFHRLKSMGSPREVTDFASLLHVSEGIGITKDELLSAAKFSLASLGEIVKTRAPRGKKGELVRQFEEDLELHGAVTRQNERFSLVSTKNDEAYD